VRYRHPVLAEADPGWLARSAVLRGLQALAAAGLSFDIVTLPHQLPGAVTAAESVPELTMVLDHLGGPPVGSGQDGEDSPWAAAIRRLAALPNVTCKLTEAATEQSSVLSGRFSAGSCLLPGHVARDGLQSGKEIVSRRRAGRVGKPLHENA
jgi:predicted TIM-barrel fold metal-dependent hydrolase